MRAKNGVRVDLEAGFNRRTPIAKESNITEEIIGCYERFGEWKSRWTSTAEEGSELILRMYQAKCGDIKKSNWKDIRPQLEEIFQIPLETFQVPALVQRRIGILVWNGHADPYVEPVMQAWKKDQWTAFQREFEFMHLDSIVNYILDSRLVTAFRDALAEETASETA